MSTYGPGPGRARIGRPWGPRRRATVTAATAATGLAFLVLTPALTAFGARAYVEGGGDENLQSPIGVEVRDGSVAFVVHTIRCGPAPPERAMHGRLCEVTIGARNHGQEPVRIPGLVQKLAGPEGARYLPVVEDDPAPFGELGPGEAATATLRYDLPPAATVTHLELHRGPYTSGEPVGFSDPLPLLPQPD